MSIPDLDLSTLIEFGFFIATTSESSAEKLERCPERTSIFLIGSSGVGKSATINHVLKPSVGEVVATTGSSEPETRATLEYVATVDKPDDETSDRKLQLGIIDTPGVNDPRGLKQDACNLYSMKRFFQTHPLYSKTKCYPNLIFLFVSATDHRIEGSDSNLAHTLKILKELGVVDQHHPNVVAVLTFSCSISHRVVSKWEQKMKEKNNIISRAVFLTLGVEAPVVWLENDVEDFNALEKVGEFTLLPNGEQQPENLFTVCRMLLNKNRDGVGLSTFKASFDSPRVKTQCKVGPHSIPATDSTKDAISGDEEDLLNTLRGGQVNGKLTFACYTIVWLSFSHVIRFRLGGQLEMEVHLRDRVKYSRYCVW